MSVHQPQQQGHELALFRGDLHHGIGQAGGGGTQFGQHRGFAQAVFAQVGEQFRGEIQGLVGHGEIVQG